MTPNQPISIASRREAISLSQILAGITVMFLLLAGVAGALWLNNSGSATEREDAERAVTRLKNLAELQATDTQILTSYGWNDKAQGVAHIPISTAMKLVLPELNARSSKNSPVQQQ